MSDDHETTKRPQPPEGEKRSIDPDTAAAVVGAGSALISTGLHAYTVIQNRPKDPEPPPNPTIELPPGVDKD